MRLLADRHLALLHHLEQRRLHLGGRSVDLVGEEEVAEDRAELGLEGALLAGLVDARPDEVGRDEVGRELHPLEAAAQHLGDGLDRQRLREAGNALDQQVPAREEADEDAFEHLVLPGDHALDLEEGALDHVAVCASLHCSQRLLVHARSWFRGWVIPEFRPVLRRA